MRRCGRSLPDGISSTVVDGTRQCGTLTLLLSWPRVRARSIAQEPGSSSATLPTEESAVIQVTIFKMENAVFWLPPASTVRVRSRVINH